MAATQALTQSSSFSRGLARALGLVGARFDRAFVLTAMRHHAARREGRVASDVRAILEEAADLYGGPDADARLFPQPHPLAGPMERLVETFDDGRIIDLRWPSGYVPLHPAHGSYLSGLRNNDTAHVRWYQHEGIAPAVVCLHGWGGGFFRFEALAFRCREIFRAGFDVLFFTLPFHARRSDAPGLPAFPSSNPMRTNEGFAQALWELRALLQYLRERGAPTVGVTGMSLGGFSAALLGTVDAGVDYIVPIIPVASMAEMIWRIGEGTSMRRRAEAFGASLTLLSAALGPTTPLARKPLLAPEHVLVIAGERDAVVPEDHPDRLAEHFGGEIVRFPGSHLVHAGKDAMLDALIGFAKRHNEAARRPATPRHADT